MSCDPKPLPLALVPATAGNAPLEILFFSFFSGLDRVGVISRAENRFHSQEQQCQRISQRTGAWRVRTTGALESLPCGGVCLMAPLLLQVVLMSLPVNSAFFLYCNLKYSASLC